MSSVSTTATVPPTNTTIETTTTTTTITNTTTTTTSALSETNLTTTTITPPTTSTTRATVPCVTKVTISACKCDEGSTDGWAVQTTNRNCSIISSIVACKCATVAAPTTTMISDTTSISTTTTTASVALTTALVSSQSSTDVAPDGLHPGYAALIAIIVIGVVAAIGGGLFVFMRRRSRASQPSSADNNNNNDVEAQQAAPKQRELPESQEIEKVPSKKRTLVGDDRRLSQVSNVASGDNYADNVVQVVAASRQPDVHQLLVLTPSGRQTDPKQQQPKSSGKQKEPPRQAGVDEYDHVVDNAPPLYDSVSRERSGRRDKSKPARQESVGTNLAPIPAAKQTIYDVDSSDES